MLALRSAPPVFGLAEAERIALDQYGLAVTVRPMTGERDCNFHARTTLGREYLLKVIDGTADPLATECQFRVLEHCRDQAVPVPVPRLVATLGGTSGGRVWQGGRELTVCMLDYLPGRLLADTPSPAPLLATVGGTLARLDVGLRGFFHPALGRPIAWDLRRLPHLLKYADCIVDLETRARVVAIVEALTTRLPQLAGLRSQAIHGDCHGANILIDATGDAVSGIIDFGDMVHAPLIMECAVAMAEIPTTGNSPVDTAPLLVGYASVTPFEPREIDLLFDLIGARHAVTLLVHAWRLRHDDRGAQLLDAAVLHAMESLESLHSWGRARTTAQWHDAAGTATLTATIAVDDAPVDLGRRHRLLGANADLFYDEPLHLVRGEGVWLSDPRGNRYLDVYNNVPHVGHCHPVVVRAVQRQVARLNTHTRYLHGAILDYAEALTGRCPAHLDTCIFVNSGSEANDVAWRMAQFATSRGGAVVMDNAYHGITDAGAALTPGPSSAYDPRVATLTLPEDHWRLQDSLSKDEAKATATAVERSIATLAARGLEPAAFYLDTGLTSSGILDPPSAWMAEIERSFRAAGAVLVADEVQFGLGRSGSHFWGFERRGLAPDIVTLGKPMANGYPMGAVIARRSLVEAFQAKFGFFSTFGGNPVAACAGLAVLEVIDHERLVDNARITGDYLRQRLERLAAMQPGWGRVRGAGLMVGLEVAESDPVAGKARTRRIVNELKVRHHILIGSEGAHGTILKLRPPMVFRQEHADLLVDALAATRGGVD